MASTNTTTTPTPTLPEQIATTRQSFFDKGLLDQEFMHLEVSAPDPSKVNSFMVGVITEFFRESTQLIAKVEQSLDKNSVNFMELNAVLHQLRCCVASIGAWKATLEGNKMREQCKNENKDGAIAAFERLKNEYKDVRTELESYVKLLQQATENGKTTSPK